MLYRPLVALAAFCAVGTLAHAEVIGVIADQSRVVKLSAPARHVIIGNALIAEATMLDERTVYVLGRMSGQTNLVAIDKEGNEVLNEQVTVRWADQQIVTLLKGNVGPKTYSCSPNCEATVTPGDFDFKAMQDDAQKKLELSGSASQIANKP